MRIKGNVHTFADLAERLCHNTDSFQYNSICTGKSLFLNVLLAFCISIF